MAERLTFTTIGQGTPLVFIHGWGLNSGIFHPIAEQLSQQYQVTCIDLPGFGQNQAIAAQPYSIQEIAKKISEVIEQPSVILGWSLGGLVGTELALHHSEKVLGLVTITSSPYFVDQPNWPGIKADLLKAFHQQLKQDSKKTIDGFLKIQAMGSASVRQDVKQIKTLINQYAEPVVDVLDQSLSLLETVDLRSQLMRIELPVLRLYGRLDSLVPKAVIEQVDKLLPSSDRYTFHHASHAPFISHGDEFISVLSDWLTGKIT